MKWEELVAALKEGNFKSAVITGPHRSGTTIATVILAEEMGWTCYPEEKCFDWAGVGSAAVHQQCVLQAPLHSSKVHTLARHPQAAIVFMIRDVEDILASERRIKWGDRGEGNEPRMAKLYGMEDMGDKCIAEIKYDFWYKAQRPALGKQAFDLDYESLKTHPLWVAKEKRKDFMPRQVVEDDINVNTEESKTRIKDKMGN